MDSTGNYQEQFEHAQTTMVDKIPWDTWVTALILCVFNTEFYKSTVIRFKLRCFPPLPSPNTMLKLWRNNMYTCPTL